MIQGQILNKLNTVEELVLLLVRQMNANGQSESGCCDKIDALILSVTTLQTSVDNLDKKVDMIIKALPDLKCRFPGGKPENTKTTKKNKGE